MTSRVSPLVGLFGIAVYQATPRNALQPATETERVEKLVYYHRCRDALPLAWRRSIAYREGLDGDSDGIACERIGAVSRNDRRVTAEQSKNILDK